MYCTTSIFASFSILDTIKNFLDNFSSEDSERYITLDISDCIIALAHSLQGNFVTYNVDPFIELSAYSSVLERILI